MCDSEKARRACRHAPALRFATAVFVTALLFGCMPYELRSVLDGPNGKPLSVSPSATVVIAGNSVVLTAVGGVGPYVFGFVSGSGTGSIDSAGLFTATSPGTAIIRVTDKTGKSVDATVTVQTAAVGLTISPASITVSVGQTFTFFGVGGTGPYTWTMQTLGSGSPSVSATGVYVAGNTPGADVVRLTDAASAFVTATVTVNPPVVGLAISPTAISLGIGGTVTFSATGGTGPYTWTIQTVGSGFPTISPTGVYVAGITPGTDVVRLTDSTAAFVTATVTVTPLVPLTISPTAINLSIGGTVAFVGIGGTAPYTWTIQTAGSGSPAVSPTGVYVAGNTPNTTDIVRLTDAASAFVTATVTVTPLSSVDYSITGTAFSGTGTVATALAGGQTFALKNIGTSSGAATVDWSVYLSANIVLDGGDAVVASSTTPALAAGASNPAVPVSGSFPAVAPGPYYLIVQVTSADDTTPGNNTSAAIPITLSPQNIDYVVNPVSNTGPLMAGGGMTGDFTIKNQGSANGGTIVFWQVRASADTTFDATDYIIAGGSIAGGLNANTTSAPINFSGSWPSIPGPWNLLAAAVSADDINNLNNVSAATLVTTTGVAPTDVEYTVQTVTSGGGVTAGKPLSGSFTYKNNGTSAGAQSVFWTAYVSSDATLQLGTDAVIDSGTVGPLGASPSSAAVPFTGTWPSAPGTWYLIVSISCSEDINPTNNITSSAGILTTAPNVNYNVTVVNSTGGTTAGDPLTGNFTYRNAGASDGSQAVVWTAYVSSDAVLQIGTDMVIDSGVVPALAATTTSGAIAFGGAWPAGANSWYLIVSLTVAEDVVPGNNTTATAAPIPTSAPDVNYTVTSVNLIAGFLAGGPFSGNVTLKNVGTHAGTQFVPWRAYVSTDATLQVGTDTLVSSGFLPSPGLAAGASSAALPITGTWPGSTTTKSYYVIVEVGAGDDVFAGNNIGLSVFVAISAPDIEYQVTAVNNTGGTSAGGPIVGDFTLHNQGINDGVSTINWAVHVSTDATLQVTDPIVATGSRGPLPGSATLTGIAFAGTWPVTAGTWYLIVEANASDDINPANNWKASAAIPVTLLAPNYVTTAVPLPAGALTGLAVSGNFTVQNTGTAAGAATVDWEVYASLTNNTYDAGDTLIATGSFGPLGIAGTSSPGYAGTWPMTPGTYYIIVRVVAADDTTIADVASGAVLVTSPPAPDYTATFNAAIPWSGIVGTAISLTGTPQITIQNLSVNTGHQNIVWAVYLSTNNVLDAGDTLVQQGSIGPLAGSASTPQAFAGNWPAAPGQLYYLIASIQAIDDNNPTNNVVIAPHVCSIGDYRYVEGAENNNAVGPSPSAQVSDTLVTTLGANQTIALEGTMDAFNKNDTYKFTTIAGLSRLSMRAMWATGFDDIDLYLWDDGTTNLSSLNIGINAEPGGSTFDVTAVTPRVCYVSAAFWLANNTSGSTGQKYVILVRGLP